MELRVISNPITGTGPAKGLLSNLFYGCGYNFYRNDDRLGADDLLIRGKLRQLLTDSRAHLSALVAAFRHQNLPPPDPQCPAVNPVALAMAKSLEDAQRRLEAMEAAIRTTAMPQRAGLRRRHDRERGMFERLVALDGETVLALVRLRDAIAAFHDGAAAAAAMGQLLRASEFGDLWSRREALLAGEAGPD